MRKELIGIAIGLSLAFCQTVGAKGSSSKSTGMERMEPSIGYHQQHSSVKHKKYVKKSYKNNKYVHTKGKSSSSNMQRDVGYVEEGVGPQSRKTGFGTMNNPEKRMDEVFPTHR